MDLRGKGNTADFGVHKKKVWDTKEKKKKKLRYQNSLQLETYVLFLVFC